MIGCGFTDSPQSPILQRVNIALIDTTICLGWRPLGNHWIQIDESSARLALTKVLSHDLIYGAIRLDAPVVSESIELLFSDSNSTYRLLSNASWTPRHTTGERDVSS